MKAVIEKPVRSVNVVSRREQLDAARGRLAITHDLHPRDRSHKSLDALPYPEIDIVGTAQFALMDAILFWFCNALPRVENEQIINAAIIQRERGQLDNIDQFPRLDEGILIRLDLDCAQGFF